MKHILMGIAPLLIGVFFIMLGNGMQFKFVGLRGDFEGFSAGALAVVTLRFKECTPGTVGRNFIAVSARSGCGFPNAVKGRIKRY